MKNSLKKYFSFNSREKNAIIILSALIIVVIIINISDLFKPKDVPYDFSEFKKEIEDFENSIIKEKTYVQNKHSKNKTNLTPEYFYFNPNHTTPEEWTKLGLSTKQIKTILNYQSKGGYFYKKTDLKKIYGIDQAIYQNLEPYIVLEEKPTVKRKTIQHNLNSLDSLQISEIKEIDKKLLIRILKYRDLLGGFSNINQLTEVYGMNDYYSKIVTKLFYIDTSKIKKLSINTVTYKELEKHPYISKYEAETILSYRNFINKKITSKEEIKSNNLLEEETLKKIIPYLSFE